MPWDASKQRAVRCLISKRVTPMIRRATGQCQGRTPTQVPGLFFFPPHCEQVLSTLRTHIWKGRELTCYIQQPCGGEGMPRKESTGTYSTGCWGQGEACLVHLGMNTEGGRERWLISEGARSQGTGWRSAVFHPDSPVSPKPSPSREEGYKCSQRETRTHRETVRNRHRKKRKIRIRQGVGGGRRGRDTQRNEVGQKLLPCEHCPLALHLSLKSVVVLPAVSSLPPPSKDCLLGHVGPLHCGDSEPRRRRRRGGTEGQRCRG